MMNKVKILLVATLSVFSSIASAVTVDFGTLLSGNYQPSSVFATLEYSTIDNLTYSYSLEAKNLDLLFSTGAFIGKLAVATSPDVTNKNQVVTVHSPDGVVSLDDNTSNGPSGNEWDFNFIFGQGANDRFNAGETVTWTATYADNVARNLVSPYFALHVQNLTDEDNVTGQSAWYGPSPVPVPAAAWLFGSALIGFVSLSNRRRV